MLVGNVGLGIDSGPLRGKLDTGAAYSIIPQRLVGLLGLTPHNWVWSQGYDGGFSRRAVYFTQFIIEGHELPMVECVATERETVLVGRNVLNQFIITLDGKNLRFELKRA